MGEPSCLADEQLRTLDRLSRISELAGFYLAGGSAVAIHLSHRRSSLDLFSVAPDANLELIAAAVRGRIAGRSRNIYHRRISAPARENDAG